jgi:hypothetical protein
MVTALIHPSAEYMQIYILLGLSLAAIAGIAYISLAPSRKLMKVTFDDVEDDTDGP